MPVPTVTVTVTSTPSPADMAALDLGSWPEWLAAVVAFLALVGAAFGVYFAYRAVVASREANQLTRDAFAADVQVRREAQARLIYSTTLVLGQIAPGDPVYTDGDVAFPGGLARSDGRSGWVGQAIGLTVKITLHNGSDELIGPFSIGVYDYEGDEVPGGNMRTARRDPLLPSETSSMSFGVETAHKRGNLLRGDIIFRDSSGQVWRRRGAEPIEEYDGDPPWNGLIGLNRA